MITRAKSTCDAARPASFSMGENRCCWRAAGIANTTNAAIAAT